MAEKKPLIESERSTAHSTSITELSSSKQQQRYSNRIFLNEGKAVNTYFIPAYLSVLFKKFGRFDLLVGSIEVSIHVMLMIVRLTMKGMTLILRINVAGLDEEEREVVKSGIKLRINEEEALTFDAQSSELKELDGIISFTARLVRTISFVQRVELNRSSN